MLDEVAHDRPVAGAAEPGHAVLHVGEEALAGLLAVVADVDARLDLGRDDLRAGLLDRPLQLRRVDLLAPAAPAVQLGQGGGPRAGSRRGW